MALPDPYADEPTTEVDEGLYLRWMEARANSAAWEVEEKNLRKQLEGLVGSAHAGTVRGVKVLTYRPIDRVATSALRTKYPDLTERFVRPITTDTFDLSSFEAQHPDLVAEFRSRQFRPAG